ncbi:MAG: hypothetical protein R2787_00385 [Saprospiraceae bacterium]
MIRVASSLRDQSLMDGVTPMSWEDLDKAVMAGLATGGSIRMVSRTILSPTAKAAIAAFREKYPNAPPRPI